MTDTMKIMIRLIRAYWWYEEGHLEAMTEDEVRDIYNRLIDWIGWGAGMTAEDYRAELELQYSVTELEYQQESGG